ncbi:MAG: hypothetical protein A2351_01905 [Omnitrophica bacterium RIFOXYB12_FULL_50_7]|nr:MAG: hypothetical protein A2351_01905 [Omnitrophica bacterium RIFOXYB12_FULL_50_7]
MKLLPRGRNILEAEIQGVSNHGVWLYAGGEEYFLPYKAYPWFLKATVRQIYNVEFLFGRHLRWPDLDVDLELDALKHPENYPLIYSGSSRCDVGACVREKNTKKYGKKK